MYSFETMLKNGEQQELLLDRFLSHWYKITPVSMELQRLGIDRIFEDPRHRRFSVEYKADATAARTGRAFLETVSVDTANKPGWVLTSLAQLLVYYVPLLEYANIYNVFALKSMLPALLQEYSIKRIPNNGYQTHGIAVPFHVLKPCMINPGPLKICHRMNETVATEGIA